MGVTGSKNLNEKYQRLNAVVNSLIDNKNSFKFGDYKSLVDNVCSNVVILIQRDLEKHTNNDDIFDIGKKVHIIPRDYVGQDTDGVCSKIAGYYARILKVLLLIKVVLDTENNGDLSFAGIIAKNVTVNEGMMSIAFCNMPHTDQDGATRRYVDGVDFEKLESFNYFIKNALGEREHRAFLTNIQLQLSHNTKTKMCSDPSMSDKQMSLITGRMEFVKDKPHCVPRKKGASLRLGVEKLNPVFAPSLCFSHQTLIVPSEDPMVKVALEQFHGNYHKTLSSIDVLLGKLVVEKKGTYELKRVAYNDVVHIETRMKALIKEMHLRTIVDFQNLINVAIETKKRQVKNSSIFIH